MGGKNSKDVLAEEGGTSDHSNPEQEAKFKSEGVHLTKEIIDFGLTEKPCPLKETVTDALFIRNNTAKKIKFRFDPIATKACKLVFSPASGTIPGRKKTKVASKKIGVKMVLEEPESLNFRVNLRINGGETKLLTVRAHPDLGVFGADPTTLKCVEDSGYNIPLVLAQMKASLTERNAFEVEGIFRLAGDASEMKIIKDKVNQSKTFEGIQTDINTVANLLKVWYRDMPVPVLNAMPSTTIAKAGNPDVCIQAFKELQEPQKTLLGWLLTTLAEVSVFRKKNKMSAQNLAIVVAPNLYDPPGSDPMEGLVMSQKAVQFLHNLLLSDVLQSVDDEEDEEDD